MITHPLGNEKSIRRLDPFLKLEKGQYIGGEGIYDADGKLIGPLPVKEYSSLEEWQKEIKESHDINISEEGETPVPVSWNDFSKIIFPPQKWKIKYLIPFQGFVIIAAPSGEKKTWIAMEMVHSITTGTPFLNNPDFEVIGCNVLYIDQEMPKATFQERGKALGFDKSIHETWLINQDSLNLNNDENIEILFDFIEKKKIGIVFIDTLRAVAGGLKEEKAEEVRKFFNRFKALKNKGVAVVFLDHCRKPQLFEGKIPKKEQLFASQDKLASIEVLNMLRSESASDDIFFFQRKNRLHKEIKPFKAIMEEEREGDILKKMVIKYGGEFDETQTKKDQAKEIIVENLKEDGKTRQELIKIVYSIAKIGERNTSEALRELEEKKMILLGKRGKQNYYTLPKMEELGESTP